MRFAQPAWLWLLLALPFVAGLAWGAAIRRRRALERFAGGAAYASRFRGEVSSHRRMVKVLLLSLALASTIVAAARPQWGSALETVTRSGSDVVIVVDTSLSMAAEDLAPSRLAHARRAIDSLLTRMAGDRVALVTFAGQAAVACPLTVDHGAVRLFLDAVDVQSVAVPGSALADALDVALRALGEGDGGEGERGRAIVVFTDGEDHEGGLEEATRRARDAGVVVHAVGCGTTAGAPIPLGDGGSGGYKKDGDGRVVTTRLDEARLEELALSSGGRYSRATVTEAEVDEIAAALGGLEGGEIGATLRARYEERFQIPLALALVALVVESCLGDGRGSRGAAGRRKEAA